MTDAHLPLGDVKAELLRTDESFRQLVSEHQALDERIAHLTRQSFPSDEEQFQAISLKKQKLALKDRIESIVRGRYGGGLAEAGQS